MVAIANNTAIYGGGNTTVSHVLAVQFPEANLASHPKLEAYSSISPSLTVNASSTNVDALFKKTAGNVPENSNIYAVATGEYASSPNNVPANWTSLADFGNSPAYPGSGVAHARRLYGQDSSLQLLPDASPLMTPADKATFNLALRTGPNTPDTAGAMTHYLVVRVTYTGGTNPRCVFLGNIASVDTPGGAVWRALSGQDSELASYLPTPGATAVRRLLYGDTGTNPSDPNLTRPASGNLFSGALVAKE